MMNLRPPRLWFVVHGKASIFRLAYDETMEGVFTGIDSDSRVSPARHRSRPGR
jgi:hypothetical protein